VVPVEDKVLLLVIQVVQAEVVVVNQVQDVELLELLVKDMLVVMAHPILAVEVVVQVPLVQMPLVQPVELVEQELMLVLFLELAKVSVEYLLVVVEVQKEVLQDVVELVDLAAVEKVVTVHPHMRLVVVEQKILAVVAVVAHQIMVKRVVKELLLLKKQQ
tara:strand:- start:1772 stop:2251 length:480 start_codon:yes stop_codon:yes gene_type:complete